MLTRPSFKKSLIVEQFQGNYLKLVGNNSKMKLCLCKLYIEVINFGTHLTVVIVYLTKLKMLINNEL